VTLPGFPFVTFYELKPRIPFMFRRSFFAGFSILFLFMLITGCSDSKPTTAKAYPNDPAPAPKLQGKGG
jgi:hypothetical protein